MSTSYEVVYREPCPDTVPVLYIHPLGEDGQKTRSAGQVAGDAPPASFFAAIFRSMSREAATRWDIVAREPGKAGAGKTRRIEGPDELDVMVAQLEDTTAAVYERTGRADVSALALAGDMVNGLMRLVERRGASPVAGPIPSPLDDARNLGELASRLDEIGTIVAEHAGAFAEHDRKLDALVDALAEFRSAFAAWTEKVERIAEQAIAGGGK